MKTFKILSSFALILTLFGTNARALDVASFEHLAVQDGGRIKPFDTFARETVQLITGSQGYQKRNDTELVLAWLFFPDQWRDMRFIQIKHLQLKKDLGIPETQVFLSPNDITQNKQLVPLFNQLNEQQKAKHKLNNYFSAVSRLNNQVLAYQEIISGQSIKLLPQQISADWLALSELKDESKEKFTQVSAGYFTAIAKNSPEMFEQTTSDFRKYATSLAPHVYPSRSDLNAEVLYNQLHPFRWAYVFYLMATLLFAFSWRRTALAVTLVGWSIHVLGFLFRCYIAGRPPVSNMYESVIWVSLGCVTFGLIFEFIYKKRFIGMAGAAMGTLALIVGDAVPAVLDQSIRPLEPVLRSNYWLTIHVLTITLSYAAFALATGVGNIGLYYYARGKQKENRERLNSLALYTYRAMQVGVLLLTAGTILGGVWADYSWGRFWGWDPKETWALIADLGYLAVLHGRFSGWLKTFGTLSAAVCAFACVIMAWYGVNFVLGVGLHSYGFGGGGVQYVSGVLVLQFLFVAYAAYKHKHA